MIKVILRKGEVFAASDKDILLVGWLSEGLRVSEVAQKAGISQRTVESRLNNLRAKTGSRTLAGVVALFIRNGIIE